MANDLNMCQFIGRLGKDPETRFTTGGDAIASFSLAVGKTWKGKAGEKQERTEWVNVTAFGKLAEICGQYLKKGSQVYIAGEMKTEKYQDKTTGADKYTTKIVADKMQMLGGKASESGEAAPSANAAPSSQKNSSFDDGFPNDIPF